VQVRREKAIYHTLNKLSMDTSRKVLLAEAWCPLATKPHVHEALRRAAQDSSTQVGLRLGSARWWRVQTQEALRVLAAEVTAPCAQRRRCAAVCCYPTGLVCRRGNKMVRMVCSWSTLVSCDVCVCCCSVLQVSTVLQPLVTNDPPPTYFKTDKFTSCFQVQQGLHAGTTCLLLAGLRNRPSRCH
jgi:hypothetical protein